MNFIQQKINHPLAVNGNLFTYSFVDRPSFVDVAASSFVDVAVSSFVDAVALSIANFYQLDGTLGFAVDSADQD